MNTLLPLMREVGERWSRGEMGIAQEHMVSAAMRNVLGSLLRTQPPVVRAPRMLLATVEGDWHDFGILAAAMIAATTGWAPLFLGPNLPASEIVSAAKRTRSAVVVIGNSGHRAPAAAILELSSLLPPDVALWLGGAVPDSADGGLPRSLVLIPDMQDFEKLCLEAIQ
jgi:cobalamin-dependent methionine synthase I